MNGDGFLDIVTSGVSILFGDGHGGFPKRADYWQEVFGGIILGDFDGDGKTDIIVGAGTAAALVGPSVMVFFAGGNSTFGGLPVSLVSGLNSTNRYDYSHVAADFNGDGFPDLLVQYLNQLSVLIGVGDGSFRQTFPDVPTGYATPVAIADFNQDGKLDIVDSRLQVFLGNGDGSFQAPLTAPLLGCCKKIAVADFNGDGKPDVAALSMSQEGRPFVQFQLLIYLGKGDGTFAAPLASTVGSFPAALVVGDFNGDGKLDLVIADQGQRPFGGIAGGGLSILLGKGDGAFSAPIPIPVGVDNPYPIGVVAADWNLDGLLDLVVNRPDQARQKLELLVLLGLGDGTFQVSTAYPVSANSFDQPVVADLNGDGIPDLIGAGPSWLLGNGDGTFGPEVTFGGGLGGLGLGAIIAADLNHDGRIDLAGGVTLGAAVLLNISQPASLPVVSAASFVEPASAGIAAPQP